jgi:esterase FrsA
MNDLAELKQHVVVHARGQRLTGYRQLLDRIDTDAGDGPGSWVGEWTRAAQASQDRGRPLDASRYYAMARFPYVDGPARQEAGDRCVAALESWRATQPGIEPLEVPLKDGRVRCWTRGLSVTAPKPLVILMGGIVTVKEQWAPTLSRLDRLGLAGLVTELPGVGENTLRYDRDSPVMLSGLLDAVADRADVSRTYAIAMSFSGHLALRAALDDPRLRAIITTGAPVNAFFTDRAWQQRLPRITVDTLTRLTGRTGLAGLEDWAITEAQLRSLRIPVAYAASRRDEIIPPADVELVRRAVGELNLIEFDDVHGSPSHTAETQLWSVGALLDAHGTGGPQRAAIRLLQRGHALRRRLGARR